MKSCKECEQNLDLEAYHLKAMGKFGRDSVCKVCRKKISSEKYLANAEKIKTKTNAYKDANRDLIHEKNRIYEKEHAEAIRSRKAAFFQANKDEVYARRRVYIEANREKTNAQQYEYARNKLKTDINYKLAKNLRTRLYYALKGIGFKRGSSVHDLGCSLDELKLHLESLFQPGMTWKNYGNKKDSWSIDHIKPLSKFDLSNQEQFLEANNYKNLQPLWHLENIRKGNR